MRDRMGSMRRTGARVGLWLGIWAIAALGWGAGPEARPGARDLVLEPGSPLAVDVPLGTGGAMLRWTLRETAGNLEEDAGVVTERGMAEAKGGAVAIRGTQELGPGAYLLDQEWIVAGKTERRTSSVLVLPREVVAPEAALRFGINGSTVEQSESMRRCGFGWMRFENAKWQMYMPRPHRAAFDGSVAPWHLNYDRIFGEYHRQGIRVLPYVFQPPEWATSAPAGVKQNRAGYPPKNPADYGEAVFQLVARYGHAQVDSKLLKTEDGRSGLGLIDAVELWNEPNLNDPGWGPFVGRLDQYFEVMRAGAEGARRADPAIRVSAAGLAGIELEVVGRLAEYRYADGKRPLDLVDIVNVHFYSGKAEPELAGRDPNVHRDGESSAGRTYPQELEDLVAWRDRVKPGAEIWLTETGNDVGGPIGLTEAHQAGKVPRAVILALAAGVDRVFVYRESGSTPAMHAGAGLLRNDGSIRPVWVTLATMIRQLQGLEGGALRLPMGDEKVWAFLWQQGERRVIAVWTLGPARELGVDLGKGRVCDGFGRKRTVEGTAGVRIGYVPTYIQVTQPSGRLEELAAAARAAREARVAERRRLEAIPMRLFDFGGAEQVGMLKGYGEPRRFTPVGKEAVWEEKRGYGFASPAPGEEDARWIQDLLERDGCRVAPGLAFRVRLEPGRYVVRVRATSMQKGEAAEVRVRTAAGEQAQRVPPNGAAEFEVEGGGQPAEISLTGWGVLRWATVMPRDARAGQ